MAFRDRIATHVPLPTAAFSAGAHSPALSLTETLEEVRAAHFAELGVEEVEVRTAAESPLAFISNGFIGRGRHLVVFHPILNHPQTPIEVVRFICKHELTHIVWPPHVHQGRYEAHPPEFWEFEAEIGPEKYAVWAWI